MKSDLLVLRGKKHHILSFIRKYELELENNSDQMAYCRLKLELLRHELERVLEQEYWVRLIDLCNTPCWRYRVSA